MFKQLTPLVFSRASSWRRFPSSVFAALMSCILASASVVASAAPMADPTLPLEARGKTKQVQAEELHLHSLLIAEGRALAIINGKQVRKGEYIGEVQVIAIERDGVTLAKDGRRWQLRLHSKSLRSAATGAK